MKKLVSFISKCKHNKDGFSLIELAIVLAIIGILGGLTIPLLTHQMERSKLEVTRRHHQEIVDRLASYVANIKRFLVQLILLLKDKKQVLLALIVQKQLR